MASFVIGLMHPFSIWRLPIQGIALIGHTVQGRVNGRRGDRMMLMLIVILPLVLLVLGQLVEGGCHLRLELWLSLSLRRDWRVVRRCVLETLVSKHLLARIGRRHIVSVCLIVVGILRGLLMRRSLHPGLKVMATTNV